MDGLFLKKFHKSPGFTLAEILIVVSIIGLIAEMTIPTLVQEVKTKVYITKLKTAHSFFEQAFKLAEIENGPRSEWGITMDEDGARQVLKILSPHMRIAKTCVGGANTNECIPVTYKDLNGNRLFNYEPGEDPEIIGIILDNGSSIEIGYFQFSSNCTTVIGDITDACGDIYIDVNGVKSPNQFGVDYFNFIITKHAIVPRGTVDSTPWLNLGFKTACNKTSSVSSANGIACAAWVIRNENMDYLKCNDLSWDGKKKCD